MSASEPILQAVRSWLMLANGLPNTTSAERARVIPADAPGPRPALPYLTVKVTADDIPHGEDEVYETLGYTLTITGGTTGTVYTVTINGEPVTYTRLVTDTTDTLAAAGLAAAIIAADDTVFADPTGAAIVVSPILGALAIEETDANLTLSDDDVPIEITRGVSTATISIQGFGDGAEAWLQTARRRLRSASVIAQNDADCVTIRADGGVTNLSALLDTSIEPRFLLEVEVDYAWAESGETMIALGTVTGTFTGELYSGAPDPLIETITVEV